MKQKLRERYERLVPNGTPRYIKLYDNGGDTFDRFTCVFTKKSIVSKEQRRYYGTRFLYIGMSEHPFHPQGFGQHGEIEPQHIGRHLGKRIKFENLPEDCQKLVVQDYEDLWELNQTEKEEIQ